MHKPTEEAPVITLSMDHLLSGDAAQLAVTIEQVSGAATVFVPGEAAAEIEDVNRIAREQEGDPMVIATSFENEYFHDVPTVGGEI